jgi:hypothetical protein
LATIHQIRPDIIPANLVPQGAKPIPATKKKEISKIKKKTNSSFDFMVPIQWTPKIQPNGWYCFKILSVLFKFNIRWMSEKYSGVRALWDNNTKTFHLQNGKIIQPPKVFADLLLSPHENENITQLDGILWLGYEQQQQYDLTQKLSSENLQDEEELWLKLQYLVFDIPNSSANLDERFDLLKGLSLRKGIS